MKSSLNKLLCSTLSIILITQFFILPEVKAVESWSGDPWEGTPWDANDFQWEGDSWDANEYLWEGEPWEGDPVDGEYSESDSNTNEEDLNEDDGLDKLCLPGEGGNCEGTRQSLDLTNEDQLDEAVKQFAKEYPYLFVPDTPFNKDLREDQMERIKQEFVKALERPYGTVGDIDIPDNVMATLAESGYSDEHLGSSKEDKDNFLEANNWSEIDNQSGSFIGFDARTYEHSQDDKIVISFGGTEKNGFFDIGDIGTDINLVFGWDVKQFNRAVEYVEEMMEANPGKQIVLTGHSLGGGIAQYVSINTGIPAVTYSAPGIGNRDQSFFENPLSIGMTDKNMSPIQKFLNEHGLLNDLVANHIMEDDIVANFQIHAGTTYSYSGDGTVICRDDYGDEAHENDSIKNKWDQFKRNKEKNFADHSMERYHEIMIEC